MSKKMWLGHVMKENLEVEGNIPGVVFTVAETQAEAVENIRTNIKATAYWVEGKSFIRLRSIFPLLDVDKDKVSLLRTRELAGCLLDSSLLETHGIPNTVDPVPLPKEGIKSPTRRRRRKAQ